MMTSTDYADRTVLAMAARSGSEETFHAVKAALVEDHTKNEVTSAMFGMSPVVQDCCHDSIVMMYKYRALRTSFPGCLLAIGSSLAVTTLLYPHLA